MPQQHTTASPTRTTTAPIMRTRRRRGRSKMTASNTTGIAFTTQATRRGETNFGTIVAEVLGQFRTLPKGDDLALTVNLIHAAWNQGART